MAREKIKIVNKGGVLGGSYFVTFIGAAVYFLQTSHGFWPSIWAFIKAMFWPGFVVHRALELLNV